MNEIKDFVYIAGYTDGDGCFSITQTTKRYRISFIITSTNFDLICHLFSRYNGRIYKNIENNRPTRKVCFYFIKERKDAAEFAEKLFPYLIEKQRQCELFIDFYKTNLINFRLDIIKELEIEKHLRNRISYDDISKLKKISKSIEPTEFDFIYFSGFIDAECHIGIQHYKPKNRPNEVFKVVIQCNNTRYPIFYWLKMRFGGSCHFVKRNNKNPLHCDQILWKLTGKSVYYLLKNVISYLRHKKPVAEKIIEFFETTLPNGGDRQSEKFKKFYQSILLKRQNIVSQVHNLNRKGP